MQKVVSDPIALAQTAGSTSQTLLQPSLQLALIGNCAISALVDQRARIVWCCIPRFDADPVFCALLGAGGADGLDGTFAVELEGCCRSEQSYDPGTAIVRTRLYDAQGQAVEVTDFAPRFFQRDRFFRPAQIVRRIRPLHGHPRVRLILRARSDWGASEPARSRGGHHLRLIASGWTLRLTTSAPLTYLTGETWFSLDSPVSLILGPDETLAGGIEDTAREFEEQTSLHWRHWTRSLAVPLQWQEAVIRAAITLKLCQYEETGAIVAAMTTSIPEAPGSQRNWDYRYCWLRDALFVVRALNSLAELSTMENYLRWVNDVVRTEVDGRLQPLYGIGLEPHLPERTVSALRGYRGLGPVRVGNQAHGHTQHDVYGNVVLGSAQAFHDNRLLRRIDESDHTALERMGERAWAVHDQPDAGMWELRTRTSVHTTSALMCWAACDRLAKIEGATGRPEHASRWAERADAIKGRIVEQAWSEHRQAFVSSFGGTDLDAGVLLMAEVGFLERHDSRFIRTLDALERSLCDGPFLRRYEAADDFGLPQTAFIACSFWRIDALARIGRIERAREIFEAVLARRNHVGLLSEDLDPSTGELWGNFPQTYSMAGIINCATRLSLPWDSVI